MNLCGTCGVKAPKSGESCIVCYTPASPHVLTVPPRPDGTCWACLWGQFKCRSCGFHSPINFLDADGGLQCVRCGIDQAFDVSRWPLVLGKTHSIADFDGPSPEYRASDPSLELSYDLAQWQKLNRFPQCYCWTDEGESGSSLVLEWAVAPGHPACKKCGVLLDTGFDAEGRLLTRCSGCGDEAAYAAWAIDANLYEPLIGVIAGEHQVDLARAQLVEERSSQVVALSCPLCRAPLHVPADSPALTSCDHCGASVRVPAEMRQGAEVDGSGIEPFWLLFRGMSHARYEAEAGAQALLASKEAARHRAKREKRASARREAGCPCCSAFPYDAKIGCPICTHGVSWGRKNPTAAGAILGFVCLLATGISLLVFGPSFDEFGSHLSLGLSVLGATLAGAGVRLFYSLKERVMVATAVGSEQETYEYNASKPIPGIVLTVIGIALCTLAMYFIFGS